MIAAPIHLQSFSHAPRPGWTRSAASVLRAGHVRAAANSALARAQHAGQDVLFCIAGKGFVESGGRSYPVGRGEVAWLANEGPHAHRADPDDPWELMWLRLDGPDTATIRALIFGENEHVVAVAEPDRLTAWFHRLFATLERRDPALDLELNQLVAALWLLLGGHGSGPERSAALPKPVARAVAAMREDLTQGWPAEALERLCGISATHLRRLFADHLNTSPRKWLMHERLLKAQNLLADTDLPISEIGARCGFADVFHFSREFKRHQGASPANWRRSERAF